MKLKQLLIISLLIGLVQHPICYILDQIFEDFDQSTDLVLNENFKQVSHAVRWDSLFFLENTFKGYRFEKNHAFLPGFSLLIKLSSYISGSFYIHLLLITQEILNLLSLYFLWNITILLSKNTKFANITALCFIFSPGSTFFHSLYSESLFTVLTYFGVYLYYKLLLKEKRLKASIYSAIVFSLSILIRSTGIFYISVSGYPILQSFITDILKCTYKDTLKKFFTVRLPAALTVILIFSIPYILTLYYPYTLYCKLENHNQWCDQLFPNVYTYIQEKHWDVGFLNQYKMKNIGFIIWGSFGIGIMAIWMINQIKLYTKNTKRSIIDLNAIPLIICQIILLFIATFIAMINSASRFFSATIPFYWCLAQSLSFQDENKKINWLQIYAIIYICYFNIAGAIQFSNFLLWT